MSELEAREEIPRFLYLYVRYDQLIDIWRSQSLRLSVPWKTNDVTEGIPVGATEQSREVSNYGYLCLSSNPHSAAMWGYYADRSKGACLMFQTTDYSGEGVRDYVRIDYSEKRSSATTAREILSRKSKNWEHESEYRLFVPLCECEPSVSGKREVDFFSGIIMQDLRAIILGANCQIREAEMRAILKETGSAADSRYIPEVEILRAELSLENFDFNIPKLDSIETKVLNKNAGSQWMNDITPDGWVDFR